MKYNSFFVIGEGIFVLKTRSLLVLSAVMTSVASLPYFETSAATGLNVAKAVDCLLDQVMLRMEKSIDKAHLLGVRNGQKVTESDLPEMNEEKGFCGC